MNLARKLRRNRPNPPRENWRRVAPHPDQPPHLERRIEQLARRARWQGNPDFRFVPIVAGPEQLFWQVRAALDVIEKHELDLFAATMTLCLAATTSAFAYADEDAGSPSALAHINAWAIAMGQPTTVEELRELARGLMVTARLCTPAADGEVCPDTLAEYRRFAQAWGSRMLSDNQFALAVH